MGQPGLVVRGRCCYRDLMNYYNEFDPSAAAWLRELIVQGHIPDGVVDERSIQDVCPSDLAGFTQCHFFAGIGGWSLALKLAGISSDTRLWTGSCPCQPFSTAGKGDGFADERHLWPDFHFLIEQCRPPIVLGEQVASADGLHWLDLVRADVEGAGYAFGAADLCAAGLGAPHIRQRLYWVADARSERHNGQHPWLWQGQDDHAQAAGGRAVDRPAGSMAAGHEGELDGVGHTELVGSQSRNLRQDEPAGSGIKTGSTVRASAADSFWGAADWLLCRDGKWRPVEPGTFPLAHGIPARVGRLRGYGNAIPPEVAAAFIRAAIVTA